MAKERGMTLQEYNVLGETKAFTDIDIDRWQRRLGRERDNLVVEGRTSFHFIPHSMKVFLKVNLTEAARRIFHDPSHARRFEASHHYHTVKELEHGLRGRMASDTRRYRKYYRLDIFQLKHYDLVINSTSKTPQQTLVTIIKYLANAVRGKGGFLKDSGNNLVGTNAGKGPFKKITSNGAKVSQKSIKVDKPGTKRPQVHKIIVRKSVRRKV